MLQYLQRILPKKVAFLPPTPLFWEGVPFFGTIDDSPPIFFLALTVYRPLAPPILGP
jgi:hypothetical protein